MLLLRIGLKIKTTRVKLQSLVIWFGNVITKLQIFLYYALKK